MESDMKAALDELIEYWKEYQDHTLLESGDLEILKDIMARVCLKYLGRAKP